MIRRNAPKTTEVKKLQDELDKVFSEYVRLVTADKSWFNACYTCGFRKPKALLQAGHFKKRRHLATRWDVRNVKPQCYGCNIGKDGNDDEFAKALVAEYGPDILDELEIKKNSVFKASPYEYKVMIEEYKQKIKQL